MKARQLIATAIAVVLGTATAASAQQTAEELYQAGLYQEEVQGNLEVAIHIYERILEDFPSNRPASARALMHVGLCHEKLGSREAQEAYERLLREYADQTELVTRARTRLAALRRPTEEAGKSMIVTRRVPADAGFIDGAPAPDGRYFAYVDYSTGDVAVQDLVTGESRRLTDEGSWETPAHFAINVSVSPDSKTAAYTWQRDSIIELRVVGLDGSPPRILCSNTDERGYTMSWSRDGRHLAVPTFDSTARTGSISWVSIEDGSTRKLATFPSWEWVSLSHSRDDKFVAVEYPIEQDSGRYDIFLLPTDGSGAVPLVNHPANDRLLGWLPNTDRVLFLSDRSGDFDIWTIEVKEGRASGEPHALRRGVGNIEALGFRDDGAMYYYYYTIRVTTGIAPFDEPTGRIDFQAAEPLLGSNFAGVSSPDGQHLAFIRTATMPGGPGWLDRSLSVRNIVTGEERVLADHLDPDVPRWFPDGKSILVAAREKDRPRAASALYRIDLTTGDARPLLQFPWDSSWLGLGNALSMGIGGVSTRDGEGLIYLHNGRLAHLDMSSGRETELYRDPGLATWPLALSPEGDEIVFAVNDSTDVARPHPRIVYNAGRLMIVPSMGGEVRELARLSGPGTVSNVAWSPDSRHVLFLQRRGDAGAALWRVSREGGDAERVWETDQKLVWFGLFPDGGQAVYATPEIDFEVWVMENLVAAVDNQK